MDYRYIIFGEERKERGKEEREEIVHSYRVVHSPEPDPRSCVSTSYMVNEKILEY